MKKLPLGIQSFEQLIKGNYVYVDKTALIYQLITKHYFHFLSRPRRFGKSLLLSTLKALFQGNKALFEGLWIASSDYDWKAYPVIHLDFSLLANLDPASLKEGLNFQLEQTAKQFTISNIATSQPQWTLGNLINELYQIGPVVILIDEYDAPIVSQIEKKEIAAENRDILKAFFTSIKAHSDRLRFLLITGVTKFSQVSLFSGLNNLFDISMVTSYATLLGYTEDEIKTFFKEHLNDIATQIKTAAEKILESLRTWYNGYRFHASGMPVFNPVSCLYFLETGEIQNYWFRTATPSFAIQLMKAKNYPLDRIEEGMRVTEEMFDVCDIDSIDIATLLYQSGYLTLKDYDSSNRSFSLGFPNIEVRHSFLYHLAGSYIGSESEIVGWPIEAARLVKNGDIDGFLQSMQQLFTEIPYTIQIQSERFWQSVFFLISKLIGFQPQVEVATHLGRIDMVIETEKQITLFEFKLTQDEQETAHLAKAIEQMKTKEYAASYVNRGKIVILVAAIFSTAKRNLTQWTIEKL